MVNSSLEKLKGAFINAFGVSPNSEFESMAYGKTRRWDSVAHLVLVCEIEAAFDIMLATDEVIGMSSFLKAKEIVTRKGISFT